MTTKHDKKCSNLTVIVVGSSSNVVASLIANTNINTY